MSLPSLQCLKSELLYSPENGQFTRIGKSKGRSKKGNIVGCLNKSTGRIHIGFDGEVYSAHRLAWFYVHGKFPDNEIDHINGDPTDNRLINLREATREQNSRNRLVKKHSKSGLKGVYFHTSVGRYQARIRVDGKLKHLGMFATPGEAHAAYCIAAEKYFGEFASAG